MALETELARLNTELLTVTSRYTFTQQRCAALGKQLTEIEQEKVMLVKAVGTIDRAIQIISANGIEKIETIVTGGLRLAMDDPTLAFKIGKNEGKRGNSFELQVWHGDVTGPIFETFGGAIWNITAFLLQIIMITRFKCAKVVVVDERFNNVSANRVPMLSRLLKDLTKNHGYTIFAITHQPLLAWNADRIYVLRPKKGLQPKLELFNGTTYGDLLREFKTIDQWEATQDDQ